MGEWSRYKQILYREDEELKRAMEKEVSTLLSSKLCKKYIILSGVDIITQSLLDLPIFN